MLLQMAFFSGEDFDDDVKSPQLCTRRVGWYGNHGIFALVGNAGVGA